MECPFILRRVVTGSMPVAYNHIGIAIENRSNQIRYMRGGIGEISICKNINIGVDFQEGTSYRITFPWANFVYHTTTAVAVC